MSKYMDRLAFAMVLGGGLSVGCQATRPAQDASDRASAAERAVCPAGFSEAVIAPVLDGSAVEQVEPVYTGFVSKSSNPRLAGAAIFVLPAKGETAEWLARMLECYGAQQSAAQAKGTPLRASPYWLAGASAQIDVTSSGDGFRIQVTSSSTVDAREILARAQALPIASRPTAAFDPR
jgi:hypothetical protein